MVVLGPEALENRQGGESPLNKSVNRGGEGRRLSSTLQGKYQNKWSGAQNYAAQVGVGEIAQT